MVVIRGRSLLAGDDTNVRMDFDVDDDGGGDRNAVNASNPKPTV